VRFSPRCFTAFTFKISTMCGLGGRAGIAAIVVCGANQNATKKK
jgi:hypothetical protein